MPPPSRNVTIVELSAELLFYALVFALGLLLSVWAMLSGSVRSGRRPGEVVPPLAGFNRFVVAAALVAFGAVGYPVAKYSSLGALATLALALVAGALGWIGMTMLMARWALRGPLNDPHEELEALQGSVALVTREIRAGSLGEIAYTFRGAHLSVAARTLGGEPAPVGTEVVIEKIENGVANVELWSVVEQRL